MDKIYYVINIIDEYTLVIDYGFDEGAKEGDKVRIFEKGSTINNLEGEPLGNIEIIKDELELEKIFDKFSICKKIRLEKKSPYSAFNLHNRTEKVIKKLNVNVEQLSNLKYESLSPISIGDSVKILQ